MKRITISVVLTAMIMFFSSFYPNNSTRDPTGGQVIKMPDFSQAVKMPDSFSCISRNKDTENQEEINSEENKIGHLIIKDTKVDVDLYEADISGNGESAQDIVDKENAAAFFKFGNYDMIADHNDQSFYLLQDAKENKTIAEIEKPDGEVKQYLCIKSCKGRNESDTLMTEDGDDVLDLHEGDLIMYTCLDDWHDIRITFWKEVKK